MKRKDIVLKNLVEEIRFNKHALLQHSKTDATAFPSLHRYFSLDFQSIKNATSQIMELIHQENDTTDITSKKVILLGNFDFPTLLQFIALAFKAGNKISICSELNTTKSYSFLKESLDSVLASQGHELDHIQFVNLENGKNLQADIIVTQSPSLLDIISEKSNPKIILNAQDQTLGLKDFN